MTLDCLLPTHPGFFPRTNTVDRSHTRTRACAPAPAQVKDSSRSDATQRRHRRGSCLRSQACGFIMFQSKRIEIGRDTTTNLPVLAECNWRFSVVEVDNSIVPNNSPKSKPLIGATRELLLFTIASIGADQSEDWIVGSFWGQRNCCHPLPH